jgi:hypothetical protein
MHLLTCKGGPGGISLLRDISSHLLHAELRRRDGEITKPLCGSGRRKGSYNTSLHVAALFIILILSTLGRSLPPPLADDIELNSPFLPSLLFSHYSQALP